MARRHNRTGRSKGLPPFVALYCEMLDSPAYRKLSATERSVLIAVARKYNGHNNGNIRFAARDGEEWGHKKSQTAASLHNLIAAGFLRLTQRAAFTTKRLAATYALTWRPTEAGGPATKDYRETKTSPAQRTHSPVKRTVERIGTTRPAAQSDVADC
jgi:hypothetical protein